MPKIFEYFGFIFYFYSNEHNLFMSMCFMAGEKAYSTLL